MITNLRTVVRDAAQAAVTAVLAEHLPNQHDQSLHAGTGKSAASALLNGYKKIEPRVTSDVRSVAKSVGGRLEGLEHRLKSEGSLARKIRTEADNEFRKGKKANLTDVANSMKDVLRFTITVEPNRYAKAAMKIKDEMEAKGYKELRPAKNYWHEYSGQYKGLNWNWVTPTGHTIEVQVHTPDSYYTKSAKNHKIYEQYRNIPPTNHEKRTRLEDMMRKNWIGRAHV